MTEAETQRRNEVRAAWYSACARFFEDPNTDLAGHIGEIRLDDLPWLHDEMIIVSRLLARVVNHAATGGK